MGQQTNVASLREVQAAQAFLRAIGANAANTDLLYAVITWMRVESGGKGSTIGNNPFGLRGPDRSIVRIVNGKKRVIRREGKLLEFASLTQGLQAMAQYLLKDRKIEWKGYGLIIRAFKSGNPIDVLTAIAISAWDGAHYGYDLNNPDLTKTSLWRVYKSFTGLTLPGVKVTQPKPVKYPDPPPRDLPPPPPPYDFIDPGEAGRFYRARHDPDGHWLD